MTWILVLNVKKKKKKRRTVKILEKSKYNMQNVFTGKTSFDNKEYICKTCNPKLLKEQIPCQAVHNKLMVDSCFLWCKCNRNLFSIIRPFALKFDPRVTLLLELSVV